MDGLLLTGGHARSRGSSQLIGGSREIQLLEQELDRVARSDAKVLITGESGVGKEIVAHTIHIRSARNKKPFVAVNCAGLPETLLESELFGHVKGSFTGAYRDKPGKLEAAQMGTAFLDEIGEMTMHMQGLLLRFLETGELQKVGADGLKSHVDVRVITATNRDLRQMIEDRTFREDLYYRLNVVHIAVPPLRDRREDVPILVEYFLSRFGEGNRSAVKNVAPEAMSALVSYSWPGNVRELENIIERIVVTVDSPTIQREHLPAEIGGSNGSGPRPTNDNRRSVDDELYARLIDERESFWSTVYPLFMSREITRGNVREVVRRGLEEARGNYTIVARMFNMDKSDYKRFLNFLRKHDCRVPFKEYR